MSARPRVLHANCFAPSAPRAEGELLLTDEPLVAATAPPALAVLSPERSIDVELAHRTSIEMQGAAYDWFRSGEHDPTIVGGISAGDLAGHEAAHTVLMPAARGLVAMVAALERGVTPTALVSVAPSGGDRYAQLETLAADAAAAAVRARLGDGVEIRRSISRDPRNALLRAKYARTRDVDYITASAGGRRLARTAALGLVNLGARVRRHGRRRRLLVLEYNPSHAFARSYGARRERSWQLICWPARPRDLLPIARSGDEAILLGAPSLLAPAAAALPERLRECEAALNGYGLAVAGVDLWRTVSGSLLALVERYGRYAAALAPVIEAELERRKVEAVLVPFDTPVHARLIVRVAQAMEIPSFVIADGYKADEIQREGMTADLAFAWSPAMRDHYYSRRPTAAIVTGDPRAGRCALPPARRGERGSRRWRVLVGGHTFSPVDINCARADDERFLEDALRGIAAADSHVSSDVVVKLHPADESSRYRAILARHPRLSVELLDEGDVISLFERCEVYVTTYSTSLLQAIASGLPVVYYRVNAQRLGPPFADDPFLAARTARTPRELTELLCDRDTLEQTPPEGWVEHYLGPREGAVERVIAAIEMHTARPAPAAPARPIPVNT